MHTRVFSYSMHKKKIGIILTETQSNITRDILVHFTIEYKKFVLINTSIPLYFSLNYQENEYSIHSLLLFFIKLSI